MPSALYRSLLWFLVALFTALFSPDARALITGGLGNEPVPDAGWPLGAVDVANLKTRIGWWEGPPFGGGQYQYLYRGTTDDFNTTLQAFARIRAPVLEVIVLDGPTESFWLKIDRNEKDEPKPDPRIDWTFDVWVPANWHRLYNNPKSVYAADQPAFRRPCDPPRIHVYVGGGGVDWGKAKLPKGIKIIDKRAAAAGVKPEGGSILRGGVFDMATGKPVSRAKITLTQNTGTGGPQTVASTDSDALGAFELRKIPTGTVNVSASAEGYAPRSVGYETLTGSDFREINIELMTAAKLSGTVTDNSGKPIAGAKVRATALAIDGRGYTSPDRNEAETDANGKFVVSDLPQGFAEVSCRAAGYFQGDWVGKLHDVPSENLVLKMSGIGRLKVTVVGPDGKPPVGGDLHVHVNPEGERIGKWGGSAQLKADGTFEFDGVPPGKYWASTVFEPGPAERNPAAKLVVVEPGKLAEVKLVHRAGGRTPKDSVN